MEFNEDRFIQLPKLVHFSCLLWNIDFDEFEKYLLKTCSQLKVLTVVLADCNGDFLDSYRWERLIEKHITQLNRFVLNHTELFDQDFHLDPVHRLIKAFTSSFWVDHQWIFRLSIQQNQLTYLIIPYKYRSLNFFFQRDFA